MGKQGSELASHLIFIVQWQQKTHYKHISKGYAGKMPKSLSYVTQFLLPDRRGALQ